MYIYTFNNSFNTDHTANQPVRQPKRIPLAVKPPTQPNPLPKTKDNHPKMKLLILAAATLFTSLAAAGVVITPIRPEQVIPKASDDCYFGVTTPQGCGCVSPPPPLYGNVYAD